MLRHHCRSIPLIVRLRRLSIAAIIAGLLLSASSCGDREEPAPTPTPAPEPTATATPAPTPNIIGLSEGIECVELAAGSGKPAEDGAKVRVRVRVLGDERMLDDAELRFVLGEARSLIHVEEALRGMMPGGRRRIAGDPAVLYPGGVPDALRNSPIVAVEIEYLGEE